MEDCLGMSALTKIEIQNWLSEKHDGSREWLSAKLGVSKGTVDQWFCRGFSESALASISMVMELDHASTASASAATDSTALIQFTSGEFERIEEARAAVGSPARPVFYRDAIIAYVGEIEEGRDDPGAVATD